MEKQKVFDIKMITAKFFNSVNRVNCAASYGMMMGGQKRKVNSSRAKWN